jgi:hypothetical protein
VARQIFSPAKVSSRKKLNPDSAPTVWRLTEEDLDSIRTVVRQGRHPYDFSAAPDSERSISLEEFLQRWEETFPFAKTDVLDRWRVKYLSPEAFNYYIDRSKITVPGTFSGATTAKLIIYCLLIMEAEHEALQEARVRALKFVRPDAQDVVNSLAARSQALDRDREWRGMDLSIQFSEAVRNPVVRTAVNNAATKRWGLSPKNWKLTETTAGEKKARKS